MVRAGTDRPSAFRSPDVGRRPESGEKHRNQYFQHPPPDSIRATKAVAALIDGQFDEALNGTLASNEH